jgi:hypothetical protein
MRDEKRSGPSQAGFSSFIPHPSSFGSAFPKPGFEAEFHTVGGKSLVVPGIVTKPREVVKWAVALVKAGLAT